MRFPMGLRGAAFAGAAVVLVVGFFVVRGVLSRHVMWERLGEPPPETPVVTRPVRLFFSSATSPRLVAEQREAPVTAEITQTLRAVVEELIDGPADTLVATFPRQTVLRQLYLGVDGVLYLDFGSSLVEKHPGGSSAEYATLGSLVRTMTVNFPEVTAVQILIDGRPRDTLAGHYDISEALRPESFLP
jgi:germination protein M